MENKAKYISSSMNSTLANVLEQNCTVSLSKTVQFRYQKLYSFASRNSAISGCEIVLFRGFMNNAVFNSENVHIAVGMQPHYVK